MAELPVEQFDEKKFRAALTTFLRILEATPIVTDSLLLLLPQDLRRAAVCLTIHEAMQTVKKRTTEDDADRLPNGCFPPGKGHRGPPGPRPLAD
jgi:hypothetical protein